MIDVMDAEWVTHLKREVRAYMTIEGIASALNDTKWRELCLAMHSLPSPPRYRIKPLLRNEVSEWDREWFYHPLPYVDIEWLEIDTRTFIVESKGTAAPYKEINENRSDAILAILKDVNVPYRFEGEHIRVCGYIRPQSRDSG
jgi:hypothetical protein